MIIKNSQVSNILYIHAAISQEIISYHNLIMSDFGLLKIQLCKVGL